MTQLCLFIALTYLFIVFEKMFSEFVMQRRDKGGTRFGWKSSPREFSTELPLKGECQLEKRERRLQGLTRITRIAQAHRLNNGNEKGTNSEFTNVLKPIRSGDTDWKDFDKMILLNTTRSETKYTLTKILVRDDNTFVLFIRLNGWRTTDQPLH